MPRVSTSILRLGLMCRASRRRRSGTKDGDSEEAAAEQEEEEEEEEGEEQVATQQRRRKQQRHSSGAGPPFVGAQQGSAAQRKQQPQQPQLGQPAGEEESLDEAGDSAVGPLRPSPALRTPPVRRLLPALSPYVAGELGGWELGFKLPMVLCVPGVWMQQIVKHSACAAFALHP